MATSPTPKVIATMFSHKLELTSQLRFALCFIEKSTRSIQEDQCEIMFPLFLSHGNSRHLFRRSLFSPLRDSKCHVYAYCCHLNVSLLHTSDVTELRDINLIVFLSLAKWLVLIIQIEKMLFFEKRFSLWNNIWLKYFQKIKISQT